MVLAITDYLTKINLLPADSDRYAMLLVQPWSYVRVFPASRNKVDYTMWSEKQADVTSETPFARVHL